MKNIIIFVFFILNYQLFAHEHIVFSSINANDELSENSVRTICQLNNGRMVIVTWGMINIYDGTNFSYSHYNDRKDYSLCWQNTLTTDTNGKCWIDSSKQLLPAPLIANLRLFGSEIKTGKKYNTSFWQTTLAYIIYILLFAITAYLAFLYFIRLHKQKMDKKHKEALDQMKLSFFTNFSHELRIPLTLILTPLGSILRKINNEPLKKQLTGVYFNAQDLLRIVNQLLDFRKLELKGETLHLSYCNVNEFLETIFLSFKELANEKEINFSFECVKKNIYTFIDKDILCKIVNNLLSNAFNFTPKGGHILFRLNRVTNNSSYNTMIRIQVIDTGCGIPEDELAQIFNRFYRTNNPNSYVGSGIGLCLVKEYVQLYNGVVNVESRVNEGSTFTVDIPIKMPATDENPIAAKKKKEHHRFKLLVLDNSIKFRSYLFDELSEKYEVLTASNGKEGLEKAREHQPDLVIINIMIHEMPGTWLCRDLKNDPKISHIPVILITARTSYEAHNQGFQSHADAYITKPFNMNILLLKIQNLIEQQEQRRNVFKKSIIANSGVFDLTKSDMEFINKAMGHVQDNINNPSYSVEQLSKDMCMDRTGLYRKLLAIAEQTPTGFIRSIRLKKAAQLLEEGLSVNEVSENVGFGTTSYFIKCFQKEFGIKPFQYKNNRLVKKKTSIIY